MDILNKMNYILTVLTTLILAPSLLMASPVYVRFTPAGEPNPLIFDRTKHNRLIISQAILESIPAGYDTTLTFKYKQINSQGNYLTLPDWEEQNPIFWVYDPHNVFKAGSIDLHPDQTTIKTSERSLHWKSETITFAKEENNLILKVGKKTYYISLDELMNVSEDHKKYPSEKEVNIMNPELKIVALGDMNLDQKNDIIIESFYHKDNPLGDGNDDQTFVKTYTLFLSAQRTDTKWPPYGHFTYLSKGKYLPEKAIRDALKENTTNFSP
ncbi:MAG: hypothetical protein O3A01_05070 [bacterium]|nr:hypothetical protein [bacterium]